MSHLTRFLVFLAIAVLVAGCKVAVIVVEGGEVQSIGSGTCFEGEICMVQVNDTNFADAFTAVPAEGWYFEKWNAGGGFFCSNSDDPTCTLSLEAGAGNSGIEALVASSETFYLMPVFKPDKDIITVDGKQWLQPVLFKGLSWSDIDAVCPHEEGRCNGVLNGQDLRGWTWASIDDFNALINFYIGRDELGPGGGDYYWELDSEWFPALFEDGWRSSREYDNFLGGVTRSNVEGFDEAYDPYISESWGIHEVNTHHDLNDYEAAGGAWFYRVP